VPAQIKALESLVASGFQKALFFCPDFLKGIKTSVRIEMLG
jgi:hypothetical protein